MTKRSANRVRLGSWCTAALVGLSFFGSGLWAHGDKEPDHVEEDRYWAQLAQQLVPLVVDPSTLRVATPEEKQWLGEWGPTLDWPHIPVSAANLPDGRVLTWASWKDDDFGGGPAETVAHVWDPVSGTFSDAFNAFHDMFCAGVAILEDGRVVASGGGETVKTTSSFDFRSNSWARHEDMNKSRWYNTSLLLPDGKLMTVLGRSYEHPEVWTPGSGWDELTGIDLGDAVLDFTNYSNAKNWPFLEVAPNGQVFHAGPTPDIHYFDTAGEGSTTALGQRLASGDWYPKDGTFILYDEGKMLLTGGRVSDSDSSATDLAIIIDLNGPTPVITPIAPMNFPRSFHKMVPLPSGEVLIVGGNTTSWRFNDDNSILTPEVFDPETLSFRTLADISVPRNYHSTALLLADGRVLSGGGGLCGSECPSNHQNAQVFSPHYLFDENGDPASRPIIAGAPETIDPGQLVIVESDAGLSGFRLIRMSAQTHGVNTGARSLAPTFVEILPGRYELAMPSSSAVLIPGYWMLFAVDAAGVPSEAAVVRARRLGAPLLFGPNNQVNVVGDAVSMQVLAESPDFDSLFFSASVLPPGVSIDSATGDITGTTTSSGAWTVTLTLTEGSGDSTTSFFTWRVWNDGPGNASPTLDWPGDQSSPLGEPVSLGLVAGDPDGDPLFFTYQGLPSGLTFAPDGVISGIPSVAGFFRLVVVAYDGRGQSAKTAFGWNIESLAPNDPPQIADPGDQLHGEGDAVDVALDASDPNGDLLSYSAEGLPPGVVLVTGSASLAGAPEPGSAGDYMATITVSDGEFDTSVSFDWQVTAARGSWIDFDDESASRLAIAGGLADGEKDMAQGDLDLDGWPDVVVVRKAAFDEIGALSDLLLMNRSGVLTDETALFAPGFLSQPTDARDVLLLDVDLDGWLDVVIAATFDEPPRLYRNHGLALDGTWQGLVDETSSRLPASFDTTTVQFCGVTSGDVNGDGWPDIYLSNYRFDGGADDVLLINDQSGTFVEQSQARLGDLRRSAFGTQVQIVDMDGDGDEDILKLSSEYAVEPWGSDGIFLLFNDGTGFFSNWVEVPTRAPYMQRVADLDQDGLLDLFVQDDGQDYVNLGTGFVADTSFSFEQLDLSSARTFSHGGNFRLADLDADGDLDIGISDVDSMFPPCDTGESLRKMALLENDGLASGRMIDPWGGAAMPWSHNTFDFEFIDIDRDGNPDVFAAQCDGYAVYRNTASALNSPPQMATPADQVSQEGEAVSLDVSGSDPDGDAIAYSANNLPPGLLLDAMSGLISGAADAGASGEYAVRVTADDGRGGVTAVTFTWFVVVPGGGTDEIGVSFDDFSEVSDWQLNGDAIEVGGVLRATEYLPNQESTAFWKTPLFMTPSSSFSARFDFRVHGAVDGADGMTFLLQPDGDTAFGGTGEGSGLGFNGIDSSVAVEIDTQDGAGDPSPNHVAVVKNGNTFNHLASYTPAFDLEDEQSHTIWIEYDGESDRLEIFLSEVVTRIKPAASVLTLEALDVYAIVGSQGWIGFSAATGSVRNAHDVENLTFALNSSGGVPDENFAPEVITPEDQQSFEGEVIALQIVASDSNGDPLSYAAFDLPPGLAIDAATGLIDGTVAADASGNYLSRVEVSDALATTVVPFAWTITPPLAGLELSGPGDGEPGEINVYIVTGATSGGRVFLVGSLELGVTPLPVCPGASVTLTAPRRLADQIADGAGNITFELSIPGGMSGTVFIQAVDQASCEVSNLDATEY